MNALESSRRIWAKTSPDHGCRHRLRRLRPRHGRLPDHALPAPGPRIPPIPPSKVTSRPACRCRWSATSAPTISPPASPAWSRAPAAFAPAFPISTRPRSPWPPRRQREGPLPARSHRRQPPLLRVCASADACSAPWAALPASATTPSSCPDSPPSCTSTAAWCFRSASSTSGSASQLMAPAPCRSGPACPSPSRSLPIARLQASAWPIRAWTNSGAPAEGFMPGMDVRAALTVVGDGAVGAVGRPSTRFSACPKATPAANGPSA